MHLETATGQCAGLLYKHPTLTRSCLKVHGGVPIVLRLFVDPL